jgi:hypothetical protein
MKAKKVSFNKNKLLLVVKPKEKQGELQETPYWSISQAFKLLSLPLLLLQLLLQLLL